MIGSTVTIGNTVVSGSAVVIDHTVAIDPLTKKEIIMNPMHEYALVEWGPAHHRDTDAEFDAPPEDN